MAEELGGYRAFPASLAAAPDPVRTAAQEDLIDRLERYVTSDARGLCREAAAALRAAPQPLSNPPPDAGCGDPSCKDPNCTYGKEPSAFPLALPKRPDSIYSQYHLDNWTDYDFEHHAAATRKTLAWLLELEAAVATIPAEGLETDAEIDERLAKQEARDNLRLLDYIADKIGLPHNEELSRDNFNAWLSALRQRVEGWQPIETAWTVRKGAFDDDEAHLDNRFEVLRPDATWRGVIAVSADDARKTAMEEWQDEHQSKVEQTIIPQGHVSVEYTASKGLSRVDCWVTRDEGERIRLGGVFVFAPAQEGTPLPRPLPSTPEAK